MYSKRYSRIIVAVIVVAPKNSSLNEQRLKPKYCCSFQGHNQGFDKENQKYIFFVKIIYTSQVFLIMLTVDARIVICCTNRKISFWRVV